MQVHFGSDLHLEFGRGKFPVPTGEVLVLAGDVFLPWVRRVDGLSHNAHQRQEKRFHKFFQEVSNKFNHVVLVLGNHEHYHGYFRNTLQKTREFLQKYENVHVLDNETFEYNGHRFFGSTFWTDYNNDDPLVRLDVRRNMNDFHCVQYSEEVVSLYSGPSSGKLDTLHLSKENRYARSKLLEFLTKAEEDGVFPVVVTHHAPSFLSVPARYKHDELSYAYANTGLEELLLDAPGFVWVHGHVHDQSKYSLGNGLVLCNPRGYFNPKHQSEAFRFQTFEVDSNGDQ